MICAINKTIPTDLQETLLFAIKDVSMLLSMATSADYGNEKLLAPKFISSIANNIGTLAEIVLNIDSKKE